MLGLLLWKRKLAAMTPALARGAAMPVRYNYGSDQKFSPAAMALTGGIVLLVGLGLMTTNHVIIKPLLPKIIEVTNIEQPIPPPPPEPEAKSVTPPRSVVTAPASPVKPLVDTGVPVQPPADKPFELTSTGGDGPDPGPVVELPKPDIVPPPLPDPVIVRAMRDPRYAAAFQPDYPAAMQRQEKEGRVSLKVLVGTDGRVKAVQILSATDPAFAEATERQARKAWRFKPATRDGVPQEEWFTTNVVFRLDQA